MELKCIFIDTEKNRLVGSNCTFMELKYCMLAWLICVMLF